MNYLAHSYLTFTDQQIVGQFLQDHIQNKNRFLLPKSIQEGIILHREVDTFTDSHPAISEAKKIFSPLVRLYSGAFVDVAMDYFLANDPSIKNPNEWKQFSQHVYRVLKTHDSFFPEPFHRMLARMSSDDWLYNYREDWGVEFSMRNVLNKAKYLDKNLDVFPLFLKHKKDLKSFYEEFFPDLVQHVNVVASQF